MRLNHQNIKYQKIPLYQGYMKTWNFIDNFLPNTKYSKILRNPAKIIKILALSRFAYLGDIQNVDLYARDGETY